MQPSETRNSALDPVAKELAEDIVRELYEEYLRGLEGRLPIYEPIPEDWTVKCKWGIASLRREI